MTATERLRHLLDERGVEWTYADGTVSFNDGKHWYHAWAYNDGSMVVSMGYLTPEQAIEATLGRGTCKVDVLNTGDCAGYECSEYIMHCNGCGHEFGHVLYNEDGDVWMSEPPRFCPNCGRRLDA